MARDMFLVGVNVLVVRGNKILLGKRKNKVGDGDGTFGVPGGHLEHDENMQQAAARELLEETGMVCDSFVFLTMMNDPQGEKHYINTSFLAQNAQKEPVLMEPDKCEGWQWFDLNNLPDNVFNSHKLLIKAFLENKNFIDSREKDKND